MAKTFFIVFWFAVILIHDLPQWKRYSRQDRLVYGLLTLPMFYLTYLFLTDKPWPNLDELINFFYSEPAKLLVESLKLPS